jgi:glycosyltransferase involved in cell wall biosynthesis
MNDPLVSILIPAYNSERWIAEAIGSARAQTWRRTEIIVVDDGSTDRTAEVARRYASGKVSVAAQSHQGAAAARNTAYARSNGDYIQWLDADDVLHPEKIERQVDEIRRGVGSRTLLSGAWAYFRYRTNQARFTPTPLWEDLSPTEWLVRKMGLNLHMQTDNWLVSRELSEAAGPWDVNLWRDNDGEYFCRVLLASDGVRFVRSACSYYRAASYRTVSRIDGSSQKLESLHRSIHLHTRYLRTLEDSPRTRTACLSFIRTWLPEFYPYRPDLVAQLQQLMVDLGGKVEAPRLSAKYQWMVEYFGWRTAFQTQHSLQRLRGSVSIQWDRLMHRLDR